MNVHTPLRIAAVAPVALAGILLAACGATGGGSPATTNTGSPSTAGGSPSGGSTPQPASGASSDSGAKCTDLTAAAATAALGKPTTVALETSDAALPGLTICDLTVADAFYTIQLAVDTNDSQAEYSGDEQAYGGVDVSGVGDKAFTSSVGIEVLGGGVDIKVMGPAGPVLSGDYTYSTAVAKAMIAALR